MGAPRILFPGFFVPRRLTQRGLSRRCARGSRSPRLAVLSVALGAFLIALAHHQGYLTPLARARTQTAANRRQVCLRAPLETTPRNYHFVVAWRPTAQETRRQGWRPRPPLTEATEYFSPEGVVLVAYAKLFQAAASFAGKLSGHVWTRAGGRLDGTAAGSLSAGFMLRSCVAVPDGCDDPCCRAFAWEPARRKLISQVSGDCEDVVGWVIGDEGASRALMHSQLQEGLIGFSGRCGCVRGWLVLFGLY